MEQVTRVQLESYGSMKREILELKHKLASLGEGDSRLGSSVIKDYRKGYPVPQAVVGVDWERYKWQKEHYEKRIRALKEECDGHRRQPYQEDIPDVFPGGEDAERDCRPHTYGQELGQQKAECPSQVKGQAS